MRSYTQMTLQERVSLSHMQGARLSLREIARRLDRSPSTIAREVRRNRCPLGPHYDGWTAHPQAVKRRQMAPRPTRMANPALAEYVHTKLRATYSPEQIVWRLRKEQPPDIPVPISHQTIYAWLDQDRHTGGQWYQCLRRRGKRRQRYGSKRARPWPDDRVGLDAWPPIVERRHRFGDWESDTVEGSKSRGGLLATHVERKSGFVCVAKLANKRADAFTAGTIRVLQDFPPSLRRTMTADNGVEFAHFKRLEVALGLKVYFAHPYAAWERGSNENTNGLLREFFPKGSDFSTISHQAVVRAAALLNHRPRKRLQFRSPAEVLAKIQGVALQL
jgi:IS30 family transposase